MVSSHARERHLLYFSSNTLRFRRTCTGVISDLQVVVIAKPWTRLEPESGNPLRGRPIAFVCLTSHLVETPKSDMTASEKKNSPLLLIALTLILGLGGGVAAMAFLHPAAPKSQEPDSPSSVKAVLHLETFTVDMSSPDQKVYLRVGIDVGLGHDMKGQDDGGTPTALVRDTILGVLMAARPDDLISGDGKQKLKEQILNALHKRAPGLGALEVYYTEFLMQR